MPKAAKKNINNLDMPGQLRRTVLDWIGRNQEDKRGRYTGGKKSYRKKNMAAAIDRGRTGIKPPGKSQREGNGKSPKNDVCRALLHFLNVSIACLAIIIFFSGYVYFCRPHNYLTKKIFAFIPVPVAVVNGQPVSYADWQQQTGYQAEFYRQSMKTVGASGLPTLAETKRFVLQRMVNQEIMIQEAEKYDLTVSSEEIDRYVGSLVDVFKSKQALEDQLSQLYGWSLDDFRQRIVGPLLLKNKLSSRLLLEPINSKSRILAEQLAAELKKNPEKFDELARTYNDQAAAQNAGDLGYVSRGQYVAEIEDAAFSMDIGGISDAIRTPYGFYIIKVAGRLTDDQGNITQAKIAQIFIPGIDIENYLKQEEQAAKITYLIKPY